MTTLEVLWTAAPHGTVEVGRTAHPVLTVLVGFRTSGSPFGATVRDLAELLGNWTDLFPGRARDFPFTVTIRRSPRVSDGQLVVPARASFHTDLRPDAWSRVFPPATPLRDRQGLQRWQRKVRSFPAVHVADHAVEAQYAVSSLAVAAEPDDLQVQPYRNLAVLSQAQQALLLAPLEQELEISRAVAPKAADPRRDIAEMTQFFERPTLGSVDPPPPAPPPLDFGARQALLGQHPQLQRRLGLVFDLVLEPTLADLDAEIGADLLFSPRLRLEDLPPVGPRQPPTSDEPPAGSVVAQRPWTLLLVTPDRFEARPRADGDHGGGFLRVDEPRFRTFTFDHVGAALQANAYARDIELRATRLQPVARTVELAQKETPSPPTLRSAGITLIETGAASLLVAAVDRAVAQDIALASADPGEDVFLDADDLARGVRVDVRLRDPNTAEGWRSLMRRQLTYEILDADGAVADVIEVGADEGHVMPAPVGTRSDGDDDLFLSETVFEWDGWSLASPKPGNAVGVDDEVVASASSPYPDTGFRRVIAGPVAGSLLPLRFGWTYDIRARTADVTGWSLPFDGSDVGPFKVEEYLRHEPVPAPSVLLRTPRRPGEHAHRLVVRSPWWNRTPEPDTSERHLVPARSSQRLAERHGFMDLVQQPNQAQVRVFPDPNAWAAAEQRERGTYLELGTLDEQYQGPLAPSTPRRYEEASLAMVHLPDPMAPGLSILRPRSGSVLGSRVPSFIATIDLDEASTVFDPVIRKTWPDWRNLRLVVQPIDSRNPSDEHWTYDGAAGVVTVELPKAATSRVRLASKILPDDLALFAQGNRAIVRDPGGALAGGLGTHWSLAPWQSLTLVHAVKQPLDVPLFSEGPSTAPRFLGATNGGLIGAARTHQASTGALELDMRWEEPIDDVGAPEPTTADLSTTLGRIDLHGAGVTEPDDLGRVRTGFVFSHEFGDTKRHDVTLGLRATTEFLENFREEREVTLHSGGNLVNPPLADPDTGDVSGGFTPGTLRVRDAVTGTVYRESQYEGDPLGDYTVVHEFGTIVGRPRLLDPDAPPMLPITSDPDPQRRCIISYVDAQTTRATSPEARRARTFRATTRPAAPKVHSIVPTFDFDNGLGGARQRLGGGLRIYLERPWFSSGVGEQLAVICGTGALVSTSVGERLSRWGADPIHRGPTPSSQFLSSTLFRSGTRVTASPGNDGAILSLPERPAQPVHIVAHDVSYDADRRLWFADVVLPPTSAYWPFVRLVVARYQPEAIETLDVGLNLSSGVVCDYAQVAPDRSVSVGPGSTSTRRLVTVTGRGIVNDLFLPLARRSRVYVTVERRENARDGILGWTVEREEVELTPSFSSGNLVTWQGQVIVGIAGVQKRLAIEEFEMGRDDNSAFSLLDIAAGDARRLVFLDTVPL